MNTYFNFNDLEGLIAHQGKPAVSVFLPTTRIPTRIQAESLQFKNLLRDAEELLGQFELRTPEIRAMLEPAYALIGDSDFWRHQKDGLAVFIAEDSFRAYQVPVSFRTGLFVSKSYHLKPLLPLLTQDDPFFILAVSQNRVRFFRCSHYSIEEVDPKNLPADLQEILSEYDIEKQLQYHTATSTPGTGKRGAVFHGQGVGGPDDQKKKILEYFERIDRGLQEYLHDQSAPLVFVGVDYLFPIYREANTYANLVEENIVGSPGTMQPAHLHSRAWRTLEPYFEERRTAAFERFYVAQARDMATTNLREIVGWADQGRVETIFVDREAVVLGVYDRERFAVETHESITPENRDLTDLAALYTLLREGEVFLMSPERMEMEFGSDNRHQNHRNNGDASRSDTGAEPPVVAAIYRYAL